MSGILGWWNTTGKPFDVDVFARCSAILARRGLDGEGRWTGDSAALACHLLRVIPESVNERQPLERGGAVIVFDGRLDNREELLSLLGDEKLPTAPPDPELVLAAYRCWGRDLAQHLNGDFSFAIFDSTRRELLLVRDPVGIRPLYFAHLRDGIVFASEIKALLAHPEIPTRLHEPALAVYLIKGCAYDKNCETPFAGVFTVRPGFTVSFTDRGQEASRYWDFDCSHKPSVRSLPEAAEGFRHYFQQAVRRRIRSSYPVAMWVSGGLDSSSVFCVAEQLRRAQPDLTPEILIQSSGLRDGSMADESEYLSAIEEQYGVKALWEDLDFGRFTPHCAEANLRSEYPSLIPSWELLERELATAHGRGARVLLTGEWGDDLLCDRTYFVEMFQRLAWRELWRHIRGAQAWNAEANPNAFVHLFINDLKRIYLPEPVRRVARAVRGTGERSTYLPRVCRMAEEAFADYVPPRKAYSAHTARLYESVRAPLGSLEWYNKMTADHSIDSAFPFLDRDLVQYLMSVPGEIMNADGIPRAMLRESMAGILPDKIRWRNCKGDPLHVYRATFAAEFDQVHRILSNPHALLKQFIDPRELTALLASREAADDSIRVRFQQLLRIESWLQTFFGCASKAAVGTIAGVGRGV
jgi:asparagine synthase (glutamine-hydrolysing)